MANTGRATDLIDGHRIADCPRRLGCGAPSSGSGRRRRDLCAIRRRFGPLSQHRQPTTIETPSRWISEVWIPPSAFLSDRPSSDPDDASGWSALSRRSAHFAAEDGRWTALPPRTSVRRRSSGCVPPSSLPTLGVCGVMWSCRPSVGVAAAAALECAPQRPKAKSSMKKGERQESGHAAQRESTSSHLVCSSTGRVVCRVVVRVWRRLSAQVEFLFRPPAPTLLTAGRGQSERARHTTGHRETRED